MKRLSLRFISSFALAALCLSPGWLLAEKYVGKEVVVHFKDNHSLPGKVVDEVEGVKIKLQHRNGERWISVEEWERIEVRKAPREEYADRAKSCRTADDWVKLAKWCGGSEVKLPEERKHCLEEALKLDPEHAAARKELGQVKVDGQWVDEEEVMEKKGLVRAPDGSGKWVSPADAKKIEEEMKLKGAESFLKGGLEKRREFEGRPWAATPVLKSQHYLLKCNSTEKIAKRYLQVLESLHKAYSEVLKGFEPLYTGPNTVYVFRNREEFFDFTLIERGVGGYFSKIDHSVRAYHGSFGVTGNTDMVLAHEACHQFQHRIMKDMNAVANWLIEGMAVYFGDGTRIRPEAVQLHVIPRDRLQNLQDAIEGGYYTKLDTLLMLPQGPLQCYDHGWGLIFWCLQGNNPKYKFGHKGEGKRVWDRYLQHVCLELQKPYPPGLQASEARYFKDLLLKETGAKSIEEWEEGYKKFIMALSLEPLGKWSGKSWEGTGIHFTVPEKMKAVEEKKLRHAYREAGAAASDDGVRLWLRIEPDFEIESTTMLEQMARGYFTEIEYDEAYKEEHAKTQKVHDFFDVAVTSFKGKFARRHESSIRGGGQGGEGPGKGDGKGDGKKEGKKADKKAEAPAGKSANLPDFSVVNQVRGALFKSADKTYVIFLAGPEAPFSKLAVKWDEILDSVRFDVRTK